MKTNSLSVMNKLTEIIRRVLSSPKLDYLLLALLGSFIFAVWFEGDALYFGGDVMYPLNPSWNINRLLYTWSDMNGGSMEFGMMYYFQWSFFFITAKMGISLAMAQKLYLYLNFILPGLGMYYLTSVVYSKIYPDGGRKRIACWIAALFFMFCPTLLRQMQMYWFYGVFPFILAFFIKAIDAPNIKGKIKFGILAALFFFGILAYLPNYQPLVDLLLILALYSVGYLLLNKRKSIQLLKSWAVFGGLILLINLGVLLPWLLMVFQQGGQILGEIPVSFTDRWLDEGLNSMLRNLTLTFSLGESGRGYIPGGFYFSPSKAIYFVNLFFTIAAFSALLLKRRSKLAIYFALVALLGIVISQGPNAPFGEAYKWSLLNIPILRTYRATGVSNVLIALGYAVLIGFTISEIYRRLQEEIYPRVKDHLSEIGKKAFKYVLPIEMVVIVVILICINGWPMVTGAFYRTSGEWPNNVMHEIPPSYYEVDNWLSDDDSSQNYRILAYPPVGQGGYQALAWPDGGFFGPPVAPFIYSKPSIYAEIGGRQGAWASIVPPMYDAAGVDTTKMVKLAGLLNVRYMVVDGYSVSGGVGQGGLQFVFDAGSTLPEEDNVLRSFPSDLSYLFSNGDFETWSGGAPVGWTVEGQVFQETDVVYSGSSSARLESWGNLYQGLGIPSEGAQLSWAYYITELDSDPHLATLSVYLEDGSLIKYAINPEPDTATHRHIALPRVEGQWVEVDRDLGQDIYDKFGSYKRIGSYGIQILNEEEGSPVYFDNIKLTSTNPSVGWVVTYAGSGDVEWKDDALRVSAPPSAPYYLVMRPFSLDLDTYKYLHVRIKGDADTDFAVALKDYGPDVGIDTSIYEVRQTSPAGFKDYVFHIQPRISGEVNYLLLGLWNSPSAENQAVSVDFSYIGFAETIDDILESMPEAGIDHVATYGALDVYKIDDEYFFSRLYATSQIQPIDGGQNELSTFLDTADFSGDKPVLFLSEQLSSSNWQFVQGLNLDGGSPQLAFEQLNPTKYVAHINNSSGEPFFIVLSTTFDQYWRATIDGKEVDKHLMANGYANAWYIDKSGTYDITLDFKPQSWFYIGLAISGFTLAGFASYPGWSWLLGWILNRRKKKIRKR
jgi:hypothetical protein